VVADVLAPQPGLYRLVATGGGASGVTQLMLAVDPMDAP
jgi:hypothetical protein